MLTDRAKEVACQYFFTPVSQSILILSVSSNCALARATEDQCERTQVDLALELSSQVIMSLENGPTRARSLKLESNFKLKLQVTNSSESMYHSSSDY